WLSRPLRKSVLHAVALAVLSLALLLTFSRGAWAAAALAVAIYLYIAFVTSRRDADRLRIFALVGAGVLGLAGLLAVTLSHDSAGNLFAERASLTQSYDVGPEGRFGGQRKAIDLIAENPFGIGFGEFPRWHHHEDVHNVYLSMLLNAGWVGGAIYIGLVLGLVTLGLQRAFAPGPLQGPLLVAAASLAAMAFEGLIVDTDHWRHFYLLLALVVGVSTGRRTREAPPPRATRIVADRRPLLLRPVVVLPPAWRSARIVGPAGPLIAAAPPGRRIRRGLDLGIDPPPGMVYTQFCSRPARLLGPVRPKRRPRLVGPPNRRLLPN
ncbi:MAG: O-antigen ligase family protein, partial [Hyphomicrobiaceae bacterium]